MKEMWKDIKEYEGLYQISNMGNVKSLEKFHFTYSGGYIRKESILSGGLDRKGYKMVILVKNKISYTKKIHRLVALHFIPNPENKNEVNHIDGCKTNNDISNLEWNTRQENVEHSVRMGLINKGNKHHFFNKFGVNHPKSKIIYQYELDLTFVKKWNSISDIKKEYPNLNCSSISQCASGKIKKSGGYIWKWE